MFPLFAFKAWAGQFYLFFFIVTLLPRKRGGGNLLIEVTHFSKVPIPVAVRSKAWVCGRSLARIVG